MSQKIDQFTNDLNQRLNGIEAHLKQLKDKLTTASKDAESTIKAKLLEARAKVDAKKDEVMAAKETLAQRLETKKVEMEADIAEWKEQKEQEKLLKRADRAEEYALAALLFAAAAAEEAEVAVLEAIDARMVADSITVAPLDEETAET
ncbi:MAG: hypothetical protein ACTS2F_08790 [Thainema sp.]